MVLAAPAFRIKLYVPFAVPALRLLLAPGGLAMVEIGPTQYEAVAALLGAFLVRLPYARVRIASIVLFMLHGVHRATIRMLNSAVAMK